MKHFQVTDIPDTVDFISADTALTLEDFLIWSVESADSLVSPFLQLLFEVCHIVLGLRPHCKHQERDIGECTPLSNKGYPKILLSLYTGSVESW